MEESETDLEVDVGAFTLEDTYDNLKDVKAELQYEIDELTARTSNNLFGSLLDSIKRDEINHRQHTYTRGLLDNLHLQEPRLLPHPKTIDLQNNIVQDFMESLMDTQKILMSIQTNVEKSKMNIAYLENNKTGLEKMASACQNAIENVDIHPTYKKEIEITKRIFNEVKTDLFTLVNTIFPDNSGFSIVLADITKAYTQGGDDVYINVEPENLVFAKFLVEADIAVYHRNDRSKIKMTELL
ncbi:uncharacterized protein [Venturia canescens]|uniref:uncharacterized protein n=1 Tax=Venturia canescens TaxID=32260 RepID=UPI001C9D5273|nr:uncharacterized protein LOC122413756 [Venturia canescens]XP_043280277.1 uncharacterized protein LOC122413756 [Venturia canescens]XP_043280286.1 uncharacterized protein LOC122413756 [Venturia canescens]